MRRTLRHTPKWCRWSDSNRHGVSPRNFKFLAYCLFRHSGISTNEGWYLSMVCNYFTYKLNRQIICLNISSTNIFVFLQRGGFTFIKRLIGLSITVASEAWLVLSFSPYGAMAASRGVEPLSSAWQANILTVERRSQMRHYKMPQK